jgi:hypothetical protein
VGRAGTRSLPNIAIQAPLPEIQVSSEETPAVERKTSTESREFWEETTQLLLDLDILREEVAEINCPCKKPECPFRHKLTSTKTKSRPLHSRKRMDSGYISLSSQTNVASYLASMQQPPHHNTRVLFRQDCLVTEEPLAVLGQDYFIRSAPSRRAQRRNSMAIRVSTSYPATMSSLTVPLPDLRLERWSSLPDRMESRLLGNSLDSLDSDKMQDIQRSFLRRQRHHLSSIELEQW